MKVALPMYWDENKTSINTKYIKYIIGSGHLPILISPEMNIEESMKECEALVLPGGIDVEPTYYGFDNLSSYSVDPEKDRFERGLLHFSVRNGYPIFGICRGFQLLAYEHIANIKGDTSIRFRQHLDFHAQKDKDVPRSCPSHRIIISRSLYGKNDSVLTFPMFVNSMHHQGIAISSTAIKQGLILPCGLQILAITYFGFSTKKEIVIEAFSIPKYKIVAVQWHPEELMDTELLNTSLTKW